MSLSVFHQLCVHTAPITEITMNHWLFSSCCFLSWMCSVAVHMALIQWVRYRSRACFIVVYELHRFSWTLSANGSNKMSSQSNMTFIVFHELYVHMALIKWVHNQSCACFIIVDELHSFVWDLCAHGSNKMSLQSIMSLLYHSPWVWACFLMVHELRVHTALKTMSSIIKTNHELASSLSKSCVTWASSPCTWL
jgi:hypothetical protein